jgi:hypothetical protein
MAMADIFQHHATDLAGPAGGAFSITPSDSTEFTQPTRAIYVGGAGSLSVDMLLGGTVVLSGIPGGTLLPLRALRVREASTATAIVGLY